MNNVPLSENSQGALAVPSAPPPDVSIMTGQRSIDTSVDAAQAQRWGWLPALSLVGAVGLLLVAVADTLSRSGQGQYESVFWLGLLVLTVPIAARLASSEPSRRERLGLVVVLGLGLYVIKVMHSPYGFTFSDELIHAHNVDKILETGTLFSANPILPVTPLYPGLETVTAALASVSGLSVFSAGLVVVGVARLILALALYLFYEEVSGSARLAGIATLLYMANANFLFWSAQFSYESMALPLATLVLFVAVRRAMERQDVQRTGYTLVVLLGILAVVITHHLTSYFLAAFFLIWTLVLLFLRVRALLTTPTTSADESSTQRKPDTFIERVRRRSSRRLLAHNESEDFTGVRSFAEPAGWAMVSLIACALWLVGVASLTISYLTPVLGEAVVSILQIIAGEASARQLFQSASGYIAPVWERLTGFGSVLLMLLGLPIGLRRLWRRFRSQPIAVMLAGAGLAYFAMLGLRFSPAAWETANRTSEFLFIGLSFVLALAVVEVWNLQRTPWLGRAAVLGSVGVIFVGGVISGWSPQLRLSRPIRVTVGDVAIEPQGFAAARGMRAMLGPNHRVATDESNARLMLQYGEQLTLSGRYPDIEDLLGTSDVPDWEVQLIQAQQIQYIEVDRRLISQDNMQGYYFDETGGRPLASSELIDPEVAGKFDRLTNISRILDSGHIAIYDTKAMNDATSAK
jgi:hypothetical protein